VRGAALRGIHYRLPVSSAQVASCVLLAALAAHGATTVELGPARDHTENMLPAFGVPVKMTPAASDGLRARTVVGPACPRGIRLEVPGDFSAAAFFLAAAAAMPGATITATGVNLNPTRTGLLEILETMGARVERTAVRSEGGEPLGDVTVTGPERLRPCAIPAALVPRMIDEIPAWTIAASAAAGTSTVSGAAELRVKESDRLAALARQLSRLGVRVEERPDGLAVTGGAIGGGRVDALGDHRIAMTLAVLATRASDPVTVEGAGEIATSFPGFLATLAALGGEVAEAEVGADRA